MRQLRCEDVGMKGCNFVAQGEDDNEVMRKAAEHGKSAHGLATVPPEIEKKARGAIREV